MLKPKMIITIGNNAATAVGRLFSQIPICHVRHPNCGGKKDFYAQTADIYNLDISNPQLSLI